MHTHVLPRLLLVAFTTAFIGTGLLTSTAAADTTTWSDTLSGENVFVQACSEFGITTSYTSDRTSTIVQNSAGDHVVERMYVEFAGALATDASGQSVPYDGKFTRISDYQRNSVSIRDFELRFDLPTPEDLTISFRHQELDLIADPPAVLRAVAKAELESKLCAVLGSVRHVPISLNVHTENTVLPQAVNIHTEHSALPGSVLETVAGMTPWTEYDPCDTSPPGKGC